MDTLYFDGYGELTILILLLSNLYDMKLSTPYGIIHYI